MIIGIGVDVVDIVRVEALLGKYRDRFLQRVFTAGESLHAHRSVRPAERLAGRFAVKEAVLKALGTGKSAGILWRDVETLPGPRGKPRVLLHGAALGILKQHANWKVHVSISHDGGKAMAFVIIEGEGSPA